MSGPEAMERRTLLGGPAARPKMAATGERRSGSRRCLEPMGPNRLTTELTCGEAEPRVETRTLASGAMKFVGRACCLGRGAGASLRATGRGAATMSREASKLLRALDHMHAASGAQFVGRICCLGRRARGSKRRSLRVSSECDRCRRTSVRPGAAKGLGSQRSRRRRG